MTNKLKDQHFLKNKSVIKLVVNELNITPENIIIEIGAGTGEISYSILKKQPKEYYGIEFDTQLFEKLQKNLKSFQKKINVWLLNEDILKLNLYSMFGVYNNLKLFSSLPYSISSEIFQQVLKINIKKAVFISGKTFFNKLLDDKRKLGFIVNEIYEIKEIKKLTSEDFDPPPNTNSILFSITPKKITTELQKFIIFIIHKDNKKIKNVLLDYLWNEKNNTKKQSKEIIDNLKLPETILSKKLWSLSNEEFILLINRIQKIF